MPHLAAAAINNWLVASGGATPYTQYTLTHATAAPILADLEIDAKGLFYSAAQTFIEAIGGVQHGYASWATVKLYYTSFYSVRSILATNAVSIFYPPSGKPWSLRCTSGMSPRKENGVTHKVVWSVLARELPQIGLLDDIGSIPAHMWLTNLREEANYRNAKFPDPLMPAHLSQIDTLGLETALSAYVSDTSMLYAFDPDHAAVAFPLECLRRACLALRPAGPELEAADQDYLRSRLAAIGLPEQILTF